MAPEAATDRLRRVINKGNAEENLLKAVESIFKAGWGIIKLYFMIGLPTEPDEDVHAIAELAKRAPCVCAGSRARTRRLNARRLDVRPQAVHAVPVGADDLGWRRPCAGTTL